MPDTKITSRPITLVITSPKHKGWMDLLKQPGGKPAYSCNGSHVGDSYGVTLHSDVACYAVKTALVIPRERLLLLAVPPPLARLP
jgi:hypothetical protein